MSEQRPLEDLISLFRAIETTEDVARFLGLPLHQMNFILRRRRDRYAYHQVSIAKRSGQLRTLDIPHDTVKILQKDLARTLSYLYRPRASAHGFLPGRSIKSNAAVHVGRRWVLNIDLENFFPSIHFGRVLGAFTGVFGVSRDAARPLAELCCAPTDAGGILPQGAPTSPILSNVVCGSLDRALAEIARQNGCFYTRYADDITFSSNSEEFPTGLAGVRDGVIELNTSVVAAIERNTFRVNSAKTRLAGPKQRHEVTGLIVNERVNTHRRFIRQVRAMLHAWERFGLEDAEQEFHSRYYPPSRRPGAPPARFPEVVRGKIAYIHMIRGTADPIYANLFERLAKLDFDVAARLPLPMAVHELPAEFSLSPDTTYTARSFLRRLLRRSRGTLWVVDPHLSRRVIEEVHEHLGREVRSVKLLAERAEAQALSSDVRRLAGEFASRQTTVEIRVLNKREVHDRFIASDEICFNVPPTNSFFEARPPIGQVLRATPIDFDALWRSAVDL